MRATILDTVTGERMAVDGPRSFEWAENNWSCDCNRNPWGVDTGKPDGVCEGCRRFLVVEAVMEDPDDTPYTLEELNEGYPAELLARFLKRSRFTVMKVISSHPDWDEDEGDTEYEIAHLDDKQEAEDAAKGLGASNGDATHRAYRHYARDNAPGA